MKTKQLVLHNRVCNYLCLFPHNKQTIVLIHGLMGDHTGLLDLAKQFNNYRVIVPDLPGHGYSDPLIGKHSFRSLNRFLKLFLRQLDIKNAYLVGHSFGSLVALMYCQSGRAERIKKLVLLAPYPEYHFNGVNLITKASYRAFRRLPEAQLQQLFSSNVFTSTGANMFLLSSDLKMRKKVLARSKVSGALVKKRAIIELGDLVYKVQLVKPLNKLRLPTLVLYGDKDKFGDFEHIAYQLNNDNLTMKKLAEAGHLFPLEEPAQTAKQIVSWFNQS